MSRRCRCQSALLPWPGTSQSMTDTAVAPPMPDALSNSKKQPWDSAWGNEIKRLLPSIHLLTELAQEITWWKPRPSSFPTLFRAGTHIPTHNNYRNAGALHREKNFYFQNSKKEMEKLFYTTHTCNNTLRLALCNLSEQLIKNRGWETYIIVADFNPFKSDCWFLQLNTSF